MAARVVPSRKSTSPPPSGGRQRRQGTSSFRHAGCSDGRSDPCRPVGWVCKDWPSLGTMGGRGGMEPIFLSVHCLVLGRPCLYLPGYAGHSSPIRSLTSLLATPSPLPTDSKLVVFFNFLILYSPHDNPTIE